MRFIVRHSFPEPRIAGALISMDGHAASRAGLVLAERLMVGMGSWGMVKIRSRLERVEKRLVREVLNGKDGRIGKILVRWAIVAHKWLRRRRVGHKHVHSIP